MRTNSNKYSFDLKDIYTATREDLIDFKKELEKVEQTDFINLLCDDNPYAILIVGRACNM